MVWRFGRVTLLGCLLAMAPISAAWSQGGPLTSHPAFQVGAWEGVTHRTQDGRFVSCSMAASYKSNISLMFIIDASYNWQMGLGHPGWQLTAGQSYPVVYGVDRHPPLRTNMRAVSETALFTDVPPKSTIFDQFRSGYVLTVAAEGETLQFSLKSTSTALMRLLQCTRDNVGTTAGSARGNASGGPNPFVAGGNAKGSRDSRNDGELSPEEKLEAARLVANILSRSEFQGYHILSPQEMQVKEMPSWVRTAAVAWSAPNTFGVLHLFSEKRDDLNTVLAGTLGEDTAACEGAFVSGKPAAGDDPDIRRIYTVCENKDGSVIQIDYVFMARKEGGVYRFGTLNLRKTANEGNKPGDDPEDRKLRNALKDLNI